MTTHPVSMIGSGARVAPRFANALDIEVHAAMTEALAQSRIELVDVDLVVTVGSDVVDAILVPMRTELFGGAGRASMNVPSSAGAALGAAIASIEADQAHTVLVIGWAEGGKGAAQDALPLQADPFHARRIGADPVALASLQAQWLLESGRLPPQAAHRHAATMRERLGAPHEEPASQPDAATSPRWCDGAACIVLRRGLHQDSPIVSDFASSWRPYTPASGEDLDPAGWVDAALDRFARAGAWRSEAAVRLAAIEASAPSAHGERRALDPLLRIAGWDAGDERINRRGGGASAWFGPATGLHAIAQAHRALTASARSRRGAMAAILDLAGPIGQATTAILLREGGGA